MRKIILRNINVLVLLIILPLLFVYYINRAPLAWKNIDTIINLTNYITIIITTLAGSYLIISNIKAFKHKNNSKTFYIATGVFLILGLAALVYSLQMLVVLLAFRNGINF